MTEKQIIPKVQLRRRNTPQKQVVLDTLIKLGSHVSAGEIYREISKTSPDFSRATVFRVLADMADDGILLRVNTLGGDCKYDVATQHHYHVVCRTCGKVADVQFDSDLDLLDHVVSASGYTLETEFVEFGGLCPECAAKSLKKRTP